MTDVFFVVVSLNAVFLIQCFSYSTGLGNLLYL